MNEKGDHGAGVNNAWQRGLRAPSDLEPSSQRTAVVSSRDRRSQIYAINADGSDITRMTDNPFSEIRPAWSPDGGRLAFCSLRDEKSPEIYVMNADVSGVTRLTNSPASYDCDPVWCP